MTKWSIDASEVLKYIKVPNKGCVKKKYQTDYAFNIHDVICKLFHLKNINLESFGFIAFCKATSDLQLSYMVFSILKI